MNIFPAVKQQIFLVRMDSLSQTALSRYFADPTQSQPANDFRKKNPDLPGCLVTLPARGTNTALFHPAARMPSNSVTVTPASTMDLHARVSCFTCALECILLRRLPRIPSVTSRRITYENQSNQTFWHKISLTNVFQNLFPIAKSSYFANPKPRIQNGTELGIGNNKDLQTGQKCQFSESEFRPIQNCSIMIIF